MRVYDFIIFDNIDLSIDNTSEVASMESMFGYSIQAVFTGAPNGNFIIQGSNYPTTYALSNTITVWSNVTTIPVNASGDFLINTSDVQYKFLRVVYTDLGGNGNMTAYLSGKGF